jgi:glutathione S-transferase
MLELYHASMSVCSEKVRMALAEKGLEWTSHHFNLRAGDQQTPEYMRLNPNAVVPTLVHDGQPIIESAVINEYIDDAFPEVPLRPAAALQRARMRVWWKQLDESIHANTGVISAAIAFRYQYLAKSPEEREALFARMPDPVRRARQRDVVERGIESGHFAPALRRFDKLVADMQEQLEASPWLAGESFSLADIAYAPYVTRLEHLGLDQLWDKRPRVPAWLDRVKSRPSYAEGLTQWLTPSVVKTMHERGREAVPRVRELLAG